MKKKDDLLTTFIDILVSGNREAESDKGGIRKIAEELLDEHIKNIMDKNNVK
jgi:hypothetical protein